MQEMITSLLDYSRLDESDDQVLATDTSTVAARVLADLSQAAEEASAVVEIGALPVVRVREHEFARILQNLIGNALKYRRSDRAPRIGISAERGDGEWIFSVTDNGIGIAPEYREQVFTLFQRLHARSAYDGTGIGLAICRKLVLHNGGRIWVDSTDGEGSTFRFTLPMVTETA
jgi:light-regulated signal transduction histidine kinase (bacteriophytochrome)